MLEVNRRTWRALARKNDNQCRWLFLASAIRWVIHEKAEGRSGEIIVQLSRGQKVVATFAY